MLIELRRPYVDVNPGELSLTLGLPAAPALEVLQLAAGGLEIELRLLGFSHQVLIGGGVELSETVACMPGVPGSLPPMRTDGMYHFGARVRRFAAAEYAARADELLERACGDRLMLAGLFAAAPRVDRDERVPALSAPTARAPTSDERLPALSAPTARAPTSDERLPAFTALAARPLGGAGGAGVAWTTWHGYPQSGELVITQSRLERAGA